VSEADVKASLRSATIQLVMSLRAASSLTRAELDRHMQRIHEQALDVPPWRRQVTRWWRRKP
jgi:hypothetical protein